MRTRIELLLFASAFCAGQSGGWRVEDLEKMALEGNPSIRQADAMARAAAGRERQAGLYPNPVLGIDADEIATGPVMRGGEWGGFFEQRIVTAGKLGLSRGVAGKEREAVEQLARAQRQRIRNAARNLFYQALGDQRRIEVRTELARLAFETAKISGELANIGQADQPDQLSAEIEARRAELSVTMAVNARERTWRQIAALVNRPSLPAQELIGELEKPPAIDVAKVLERIYAESPELRRTEIAVSKSELSFRRAKRETLPDILMRGGVRYNRELLEMGRPVGKEGFFDIGVEIPLFNRNQGNVAAARAEAESAKLDVERARLSVRARLAEANREYLDAMAMAEKYEMYRENFRRMAVAYPRALMARQSLAQLRDEYVSALVAAWQRAVEMEGLLLDGYGHGTMP
jgi:outer membrane protein, heavy metal efflux system